MSAKASLTNAQVSWIKRVGRRLWVRRETTLRHLADTVGCSPQHVADILAGRRRANVPENPDDADAMDRGDQ